MKPMKKWKGWLAVALAAATGAIPARGTTETVDGVAWTYSVSGGKATIYSGNSFKAAIPTSTSGRIAIPSALGGHPVTAIGESAFLECRGLTEVAIPGSVTSIGHAAFACCTSLTNMAIPDSVTRILDDAFEECFGLTEVAIPDSVTSIGAGAFYHCTGLESITIGSGVTNIGSTAFCGCDKLSEVHIRDVAAWCGISFADPLANPQYLARHLYLNNEELSGHLEIPAGISRIEPYLFYDCHNLTGVTIPGTVTNIGEVAFCWCSGLTNVAIGTNVAGIGEAAFYGCEGLASLAIPDSVRSIGSQAFRGCAGLTNVATIPEGVTNIGPCAFSGCSRLTALDVSGGNAAYASENGVLFDKNKEMLIQFPGGKGGVCTIPDSVTVIGDEAFLNCSGLTEITIPESVTHIGEGAFYYCSGLTGVTIPDGVTNLGDNAFCYCRGLTDMTVPDSVASIGEETFYRCGSLTNVTIGANVTSIGYAAFDGCTNLASVEIPGSVTNIGANAFCNCPGLTELVIPGSVVYIGSQAFCSCRGLKDVTIPDSVTYIGVNAFYGCSGLTNAVIPDSVTSIGNHAFGDCSGLVRLEVPVAWYGTTTLADAGVRGNCRIVYRGMASETAGGGTWNYIAEGGSAVVMGGDYAGDLSIPETLGGYPVAGIGVAAFAGCTDLATLSIPDCVTNVGSNAFCGCSSLAALSVPAAWYGTPALSGTDMPTECTVAYRGIEPLAVTTAALPRGTVGAPYEAALAAVGGIAPCAWSVGNTVTWNAGDGKGYEESSASGTYAETGTAQGWRGDDACWDLALPFAFPFFGHSYTKAKINSNGAISFGTDGFSSSWYTSATFFKTPIIAVLWADLTTQGGNIHVESSSDAVAVRWTGRYWGGTDVAFSATLKVDGTIVLSYGKGNANGGFIGISAGDGATATISARSKSGSMENAEDIVFKVPGKLPAGMELTEGGVLRGTPAAAGNYPFTAIVTDNVGVSASRELVLVVAPSGAPGNETSTTPAPVPHVWLEKNAAEILAANGSDYEAAASAKAANGLPVWECYVAGLSPMDAEVTFKVKSISVVDGEVNVEWTPDLNGNGTPNARAYTVEGKPTMADAWSVTNTSSRFFRVRVELPPPE